MSIAKGKILFFFVSLILILAGSGERALAHVGTEPQAGISALIIEPDLFPVNTLLPLWFEIKSEATGKSVPGLAPAVEIQDSQGKIVGQGIATPKGENYLFEYQFPKVGDYELSLNFSTENKPYDFDFVIPVSATTDTSQGILNDLLFGTLIITGVLLLSIWLWGILSVPKKIKRSIILSTVAVIAAILTYSVVTTFQTGATKTGVVTCLDNGQCYWTAHVHAFVPITICGQDLRLPIEKGNLAGPHTHEEKNLAHWHDRLPYDLQTKQITDTKPLLIKSFFEEIGVAFSNAGVAEKQNGQTCPNGQPGTLKAFINGESASDIENYIWRDRDVIQIFFDDRDVQTLEQEIKEHPVLFPTTGRG